MGKFLRRGRIGLFAEKSLVHIPNGQSFDLSPTNLGFKFLLLRVQPFVASTLGSLELFDPIRVRLSIVVDGGRGGKRHFLPVARIQRCHDLVIIAGRQGIEFVVVTTGTTKRQSKECRTGRRDDVVQLDVSLSEPLFFEQLVREFRAWPGRQKSGGGDRSQVVRGDLIPCQLPANKLVEWHVIVHRPNDEVAIVVCRGPIIVAFVAVAIRVTSHVEPMSGPVFTKSWAGQ